MTCKTHKVSVWHEVVLEEEDSYCIRRCIESPFSVQFQILRKLSQDPVATAIPSSVTPRQLTRLSWPASTPEKVQLSVNRTAFYSQLSKIFFLTKIIGVYFTIKHFQFFYLKMFSISLSLMVTFTSNLIENRFYANLTTGRINSIFAESLICTFQISWSFK